MLNSSCIYLSVAQGTTEDYKLNNNKRFPKAGPFHSKYTGRVPFLIVVLYLRCTTFRKLLMLLS